VFWICVRQNRWTFNRVSNLDIHQLVLFLVSNLDEQQDYQKHVNMGILGDVLFVFFNEAHLIDV
jgi:hypothetical protein